MKLLVINGPNLNFLGVREVSVYGSMTYTDLIHHIQEYALSYGVQTLFFQSNHEGELIDYIQSHYREINGIIINPGAFTHYSYAIYDCLKSIPTPAIEVHLSDIHHREPFRRISVIKDACIAQISGKGLQSYLEAIDRFRKDIQS